MCGIAGIFQPGLESDEIARRLALMNEAMVHRGPDSEGMVVAHGAGLAMRRLAIIDVGGGRQPVTNESETLSLVMNGEIYNYRELGARLRSAGHEIRSASDTEVALRDFEESPDAFPGDLRGMFAVAAWDRENGSVTLAVDRLGIKPLYVVADEGRLVFASELRSLLASGLVSSEIDPEALSQYFAFGYVASPLTILQGVFRLRAGEVLHWSPSQGARIDRYWELPAAAGSCDLDAVDLRAEVRRRLRDAVESHLVSDVPLGAFLSGGVDSSTIVALMSEAGAAPLRTFSIGFADSRYDELPYARQIARRFATEHHELVVEPEHADVLEEMALHFGEPFADPASLPTYFVSRLAGKHVKVALSGDGADELFMGYTVFRGLDAAGRAEALPGGVRATVRSLASHPPRTGSSRVDDRTRQIAKRLADSALPAAQAFRAKAMPYGAAAAARCLSQGVRAAIERHDPFRPFEEAWRSSAAPVAEDPLERFVRSGITVVLPDDMLVKVDRMSMAHSLEVRVPFLDHHLVEFLAALPVRRRFPRWRLKWLLRDAMRDLLPDEILDRPKHGFTVPLSAWFRDDLAAFAESRLLSREAADSGFYDADAVARLISDHRDNRGDLGGGIWMLVIFEIWRQTLDLEAPIG
jgi:asparagine synthase (glutamine-hydrolysing)